MPRKLILLSLVLTSTLWSARTAILCAAAKGGAAAKKETRVADLLALPSDKYRVDPYLKIAQSLQVMGQKRACALIRELAVKEAKAKWPYTRTICLCRMLFKAKPKSKFRRAAIGGRFFPASTTYNDWPLEPIEIVDGVPFNVSMGVILGGEAELPGDYLRYCVEKCDWSKVRFRPKTMAEKEKALGRLLSSAKLKGKLREGDKEFFETQIK
jgi:hypothetical protein